MKWPWSSKPSNRGTLTILPSGEYILGFPPDVHPSQAALHEFGAMFKAWTDQPAPRKPLVLGFPLDVTVLR